MTPGSLSLLGKIEKIQGVWKKQDPLLKCRFGDRVLVQRPGHPGIHYLEATIQDLISVPGSGIIGVS